MDIKVIGQEIKESILEHGLPNTTSCNSLLYILWHRLHVCYMRYTGYPKFGDRLYERYVIK